MERKAAKTLDLGREAGIPPATLIGILDELEKRGLVARVRSPEDKRVVMVTPTPGASAIVERHRMEDCNFMENLACTLEPEEMAELDRLLVKMLDSIKDIGALLEAPTQPKS